MALGVVPVQTDVTGGTMHTVKFAEMQGRFVFCPRPLAAEHGQHQYAGIFELIRSGRAREFQADQYEFLLALLREKKQSLLNVENETADRLNKEQSIAEHARQNELKAKKLQTPFEFADPPPDVEPDLAVDQIDRIVQVARELKLDSNARRFDKVISQVRKAIFGATGSRKVR